MMHENPRQARIRELIARNGVVAETGDFFGYRARSGGPLPGGSGGEEITATFDDFSVTVVPEPSSMTLVALGLVGMLSLCKRNCC